MSRIITVLTPPPPVFPSRSIAAESARVVAAAEDQVRRPRVSQDFCCSYVTALQVRALELEAADAKRDAGECVH